jgi:integrase/recombinase XerD
MMKCVAQPELSPLGESVLTRYEQHLRVVEDLSAVTIRNYLSDLYQFVAWCEMSWQQLQEDASSFIPKAVTPSMLIEYRTYLQQTLQLKPASVNRSLVSLKHYFVWAVAAGQLTYNPARVVKLVGEEVIPPRHLDDQEEQSLIATVMEARNARDQSIMVLRLHTVLCAREVCTLTRSHIRPGKRSGTIVVHGKGKKYREIPLNVTAQAALKVYDPSLGKPQLYDTTPLFLSEKWRARLTQRELGYLVKKYAERAKLRDVSPHDLRHRFGYRMAASVPLHRLAQIMGHDSLDTTLPFVRGTKQDLQREAEKIAWT